MVDYKLTKIYYIKVGEMRYYGHTAQKYLSTRENGHRAKLRKGKKNKVYDYMRKVGMKPDDVKLIWVEDYPCDSVHAARVRERYWIEKGGDLNMSIPTRTNKEWYTKNAKEISQKRKEYRAKNAEELSQKHKEWRTKNAEKLYKKQKEYRAKNGEEISQKKKQYNANNAEEISQKRKEYVAKNAEELCQKKKEWYAKNAEEIRQKQKEYRAKNAESVAEKRRERVPCANCGKVLNKSHMCRHLTTCPKRPTVC